MYLSSFKFADELKEELFLNGIKRTCYESFYPFGVLSVNVNIEMLKSSEVKM